MTSKKYSKFAILSDYENLYKLVNNPFMDMQDIKCEYHLALKR